jgi:hypothetical protein
MKSKRTETDGTLNVRAQFMDPEPPQKALTTAGGKDIRRFDPKIRANKLSVSPMRAISLAPIAEEVLKGRYPALSAIVGNTKPYTVSFFKPHGTSIPNGI